MYEGHADKSGPAPPRAKTNEDKILLVFKNESPTNYCTSNMADFAKIKPNVNGAEPIFVKVTSAL